MTYSRKLAIGLSNAKIVLGAMQQTRFAIALVAVTLYVLVSVAFSQQTPPPLFYICNISLVTHSYNACVRRFEKHIHVSSGTGIKLRFCGVGSIHHTCTSSSMLDTNVDLHFAGVKMHLAEVFIVPKKHRTMGIYIVTTLGGTGAVG